MLKSRMGWFHPTEIGERLMPALTFLGPYHDRITREMTEGSLPSGQAIAPVERRALARDALHYKLTDEAGAALDALQLEMRNQAGDVVATTGISVQDTEYLMALGGEVEDDDELADVDCDNVEQDEVSAAFVELGIEEDVNDLAWPDDWDAEVEEAWTASTLPRYQIFVDLVDGSSVPVSERWKDDPYVQSLVAGHDPLAELHDDELDARDFR